MRLEAARPPLHWRRGLWRLWLVSAVLWAGGVAVVQFYYLNDYIKICIAACSATPEQPFDQCWARMAPLIGYEEETRLKMWAFLSSGGAVVSLMIGALAIWTVRWVVTGFKPRP